MSEPLHEKFSIPSSWKPRIPSENLPFFYCKICGHIVLGVDTGRPIQNIGENRDPVTVLPYMHWDLIPSCCDEKMERITPISYLDLPEDIKINYQITGGLGDNLIKLDWEASDKDAQPDWAVLKTFTGMQMKYRFPGHPTRFSFILTETDSYAYCAESPCLECLFHCKRGNTLYAHTPHYGIVSIPIHENESR